MQTISKSTLPAIGEYLLAAGFFTGIINVNGTEFAVVTAPKAIGESKQVWMPQYGMIEGARSTFDSAANTKAMAEAGSPAALWAQSLVIDNNSNWVLPARDVVELQYRNLKPTTQENFCTFRDGDNPSSVPPGHLYTEASPAQTTVEAFQEGGAEAFDAAWYISSTQYSESDAYGQYFVTGTQGYYTIIGDERRVRAVSLIQLSA